MVDFCELKRAHEFNKYEFAAIELDLAITFAETAACSDSDDKINRNIANARRAYREAMKFLRGARLTRQMTKTVVERIDRLSRLLSYSD